MCSSSCIRTSGRKVFCFVDSLTAGLCHREERKMSFRLMFRNTVWFIGFTISSDRGCNAVVPVSHSKPVDKYSNQHMLNCSGFLTRNGVNFGPFREIIHWNQYVLGSMLLIYSAQSSDTSFLCCNVSSGLEVSFVAYIWLGTICICIPSG